MENFDRSLFQLINQELSHPILDAVMPFLTDLHKQPYFLMIALPIILGLWLWKSRLNAVKALLVTALCVGAADLISYRVLKPYFKRERPPAVEKNIVLRSDRYAGYSFPSNHAANNFAAAASLSLFYPPQAKIFYAFASLISYSRVYVGVHYPLDVIGGGLLGWLIVFLLSPLFQKLQLGIKKKNRDS